MKKALQILLAVCVSGGMLLCFSAAAEAATAPSVSFTSSAPTTPSGDYAPGTARQEAPGVGASGFRMTEPPDA